MKTKVHGLADLPEDDLRDLLEEQIPSTDETETDETGLSLAPASDDEYDDLEIDTRYAQRPIVLLEQDTKIVKSKISNARTAFDVAQTRYRQIGSASYSSIDARNISIRDTGTPMLDAADAELLSSVEPLMEELRNISLATAPRGKSESGRLCGGEFSHDFRERGLY